MRVRAGTLQFDMGPVVHLPRGRWAWLCVGLDVTVIWLEVMKRWEAAR